VLFVGGILTYFVLASEPDTGLAVALLLATVGLCLTLRGVPLGQALGFAVLAFARRRHCLPLRPARLYRHGQRQKGGADPPSAALEEDCRRAHIVIAPFTVGKKCRAARVIVDRRMLRAHGAHALYIDGLSIRTVTVAAARGRRPWVPERDIIAPDPLSTSGMAYASGDNEADDAAQRFDGNPE
jgi:hypothetical protein